MATSGQACAHEGAKLEVSFTKVGEEVVLWITAYYYCEDEMEYLYPHAEDSA